MKKNSTTTYCNIKIPDDLQIEATIDCIAALMRGMYIDYVASIRFIMNHPNRQEIIDDANENLKDTKKQRLCSTYLYHEGNIKLTELFYHTRAKRLIGYEFNEDEIIKGAYEDATSQNDLKEIIWERKLIKRLSPSKKKSKK